MSPAEPRLAFVLGAPRSGTTWLARALGGHPEVAAVYETHLFNAYLRGVFEAWREHQAQLRAQAGRYRETSVPPDATIGLPYVLTEEQFYGLLAELVEGIARRALDAKPSAEVVVEKTPSHSLHVADIERTTRGTARYVHIIRSGYDAVASLRRSAGGWGSAWAPADVPTATRKWAAAVRGARMAAGFEGRYLELRYEDLLAQPARVVRTVLDFLGVSATLEDARSALERSDEGLLLAGEAAERFERPPPEPRGFRRAADAGALDARHRFMVDQFSDGLMVELGYTQPVGMPRSGRARLWQVSGRVESTASRLVRASRRLPAALRGTRST